MPFIYECVSLAQLSYSAYLGNGSIDARIFGRVWLVQSMPPHDSSIYEWTATKFSSPGTTCAEDTEDNNAPTTYQPEYPLVHS